MKPTCRSSSSWCAAKADFIEMGRKLTSSWSGDPCHRRRVRQPQGAGRARHPTARVGNRRRTQRVKAPEGIPMNEPKGRREFIKLLGFGGVVFASGLAGACAHTLRKSGGHEDDFFFVQLSDTHWGFKGPPNPEAANTLRQAVRAVNALPQQPDFIVFTGDLIHTTDDEAERHRRMREFKAIVADLQAA